MLKKATICC